jgi:hypothetical protein
MFNMVADLTVRELSAESSISSFTNMSSGFMDSQENPFMSLRDKPFVTVNYHYKYVELPDTSHGVNQYGILIKCVKRWTTSVV